MDAFWAWLWGTGWFWFALFWVALFVNGRAAFKLLLDWKGMLTTCRFVEQAYAARTTLPDEAALEKDPAAPVFAHLVPAWQEPGIAATLRALLDSRYPHAKLHIVVATREAEELSSHPTMQASTAEIVRRFPTGYRPGSRRCSRSSRCRARGERPTSSTGPSGPRCSSPCSTSGTIPRASGSA